MFAPENGQLLKFDLSKGYKDLNNQEIFNRTSNKKSASKVMTRKSGKLAFIYYKNHSVSLGDDVFYITIDMDKKEVLAAAWLSLSAGDIFDQNANEVRMMSDSEFDFIDKSLRKNGQLSTGDDVSAGLEYLLEHYEVALSLEINELESDKKSWTMSVNPLDGYGHSLLFWIDAKTGEISAPLAMHMASASPVDTLPIDSPPEEWNTDL